MDARTKAGRAQRKAEQEQHMAEWQKRQDFKVQSLRDLAGGKTTFKELRENPLWEQLAARGDRDLAMFRVMAGAVANKDKVLITMILEEATVRELSDIWGDAESTLRQWIERNCDQTTVDLYNMVNNTHYEVYLNRKFVEGAIYSESPIFRNMIRKTRQELPSLTEQFQKEHPEPASSVLEENVRMRKPAELQSVQA